MAALALAPLLAACGARAPAPASSELVRMAAVIAPELQAKVTDSGPAGPSVRLRADGGAVVMALATPHATEGTASAVSSQVSVLYAPELCRMSDVHAFIAKGGTIRVEMDGKDGTMAPVTTIDHCDA